jgi:dTDP-4-amino-4,6-dideoxygalactose transaminase
MISHLNAAGISTGIHYPVPLHLQQAYVTFGYKPWDFPATERVAAEILSLPMFPQLTAEQQLRVAKEIGKFVSRPHRAHPESEMDLTGSAAQIA